MSNPFDKVILEMVEMGMRQLNKAMAKHGKRYELREDEDGNTVGVEMGKDADGNPYERIYWPEQQREADIVTPPQWACSHGDEVKYDA